MFVTLLIGGEDWQCTNPRMLIFKSNFLFFFIINFRGILHIQSIGIEENVVKLGEKENRLQVVAVPSNTTTTALSIQRKATL